MKFEKRNFMGIELDVLVGHPEHDLLFVATQVAQAAGLKRASKSVSKYILARRPGELAFKLEDIVKCHPKVDIKIPKTAQFRRWPDVWIATEATTYQMLLRGHAPQSEPFRKWITEEVLPSIRKTGKYNAEDSQNPIALAIMDELKSLRGEIVSLRQELQAKTFSLAPPVVPEVSPYEGQAAVALCDPLGFNKRLYRELADSCLDRLAADKMEPRVVLQMETELTKKWDEEDGRKLRFHTSKERRKWTLYPKAWLQQNLSRGFYTMALKAVLAEKICA